MFGPIAIVGRGCVLPGADSAEALGEAVFAGRDLTSSAAEGRWGLPHAAVLGGRPGYSPDATWSDRGGYVKGPHATPHLGGFGVPEQELAGLDPVFTWTLHAAREALVGVGATPRSCAVIGNLSYPTGGLSCFSEEQWLSAAGIRPTALGRRPTAPANRFMSGLPALLLRRALGIDHAFSLDAACASSLYAVKLACDALHDGRTDVALAGAVNRADDLFIHLGFSALSALSASGRSRPFHAQADGLLPAEGAAVLALKRLGDAVDAGDPIFGVIRAVGLSNDGRGRGLLAPNAVGQARALRQAYDQAGVVAGDLGLLEAHATGTTVGDAAEIASASAVFSGRTVPVGSLKSNLGHLVTAAGAAGLIKVTEALRRGQLPPTLACEQEHPDLAGSALRVVREVEPWTGPRRAGVSAFGFGGNNAHVVVEAFDGTSAQVAVAAPAAVPLAVVGLGLAAGGAQGVDAVRQAWNSGAGTRRLDQVRLGLRGLRFPPNDLAQSLAQQVLLLAVAREAAEGLELPRERSGVYVGMGTDPEVARYGARWRAGHWAQVLGASGWDEQAREALVPVLEAAGVVGTMPNIPANRLNTQLDVEALGFTVSAEEGSGLQALELAARALRAGELDAAVVGAVDLSAEPVHEAAHAALGGRLPGGDAAVVLVVKRLSDAEASGDRVLAVLQGNGERWEISATASPIAQAFGHSHAAGGLLAVGLSVLDAAEGRCPGRRVAVRSLEDQTWQVAVSAHGPAAPVAGHAPAEPCLSLPAHPKPVQLPTLSQESTVQTVEALPPLAPPDGVGVMPPAPALVPISGPELPEARPLAAAADASTSAPAPVASAVVPPSTALQRGDAPDHPLQALLAQLGESHRQFMAQQADAHQAFLAMRQRTMAALAGGAAPVGAQARGPASPLVPPVPVAPPAPRVSRGPAATPPPAPVHAPAPAVPVVAEPVPEAAVHDPARVAHDAPPTRPVGLTLDRAQLEVHASGRISEIYGPLFAQQDGFTRQVRMPEPPLLLADRVVGLHAEPGSMAKGSIWTETDVGWDSWYLHQGRMPAGVMIEAGQADLMLISYLGIDFLNRGERVYRLLGCELTYHRPLPCPGETLHYDIHVDGHANQGPVRLFFFHYDCHVGSELQLSVRNGQAGFFTEAELADSAGILWTPEEQEIVARPRLDEPAVPAGKSSLSRAELEAFAEGRIWDCFGEDFWFARTHVRSPSIAGGGMLFFDEVTQIERGGGPWKRGYLRAERAITPDDWTFAGHFKNDPCMPGTLMFEGCLQAMAVFLTSLGFTLKNDGWRFEPVKDQPFDLKCRGQVTPTSKLLTYEIFVEEVVAGPIPTLYADLLCTVDGLGAFHARRVGLELVPDWPLTDRPEELGGYVEPKPVASADGFAFDYASLLSCAWGRPSEAFGPMYAPFDGHRRVARLPGPPYHFMSRVTSLDGPIGVCKPGAVIELEYDIPEDAWYFDENGNRTMPFAVLLEAALQPCGWLASYVGSALTVDEDLSFRNLDGTGTLHGELFSDAGTLTTRVTITNISQSAGMIIESFEVVCLLGDREVYTMDTVFGFFPLVALENQIGLSTTDAQREVLERPCEEVWDLVADPPELMAEPMLLMLDRVTGWWPEGGKAGLGELRGVKDVDPSEWFFKAHFYQDPVQPGSLGIEAMLQLLQIYMLKRGLHEGVEDPRFEPIRTGEPMTWKYRGQVVPKNELISSTLEITEVGTDELGPYAVCEASLWVDGKRIYEARNLGMRIVSGVPPEGPRQDVLDPARDTWLDDHCPTWTVPALPLMGMVDRLASGVDGELVGLSDVRVQTWATVGGPTRLSVERVDDALTLFCGDVEVCRAVVARRAAVGEPLAPLSGETIRPYDDGSLFHGPAFQVVEELVLGDSGASGVLRAKGAVPYGRWPVDLLDGLTHLIPHDQLTRWCSDIDPRLVFYPALIPSLAVQGPGPAAGEPVRAEVRFDGLMGSPLFPRFRGQLLVDGRVWVELTLVEAGFPKGALGSASPIDRRAFLKDRQFVAGLRLSDPDGSLSEETVARSDWLPGTVAAVYGTRDPAAIAEKEALAQHHRLHPGSFPAALPLNQGPELDLSCVVDFWTRWFDHPPWLLEDLYYGFIQRFVRRVVLEDPEGFAALRGRSVLFLANHQVGVESLVFSVLASGLVGTPTLTLAKVEHQDTWLGNLIRHGFSREDIRDPRVIAYFDRDDKLSLPGIIRELAAEMKAGGRSVMVHVEGTRSLTCRRPVEKMSGAFIDMAMEVSAPIVPVRFSGGLPVAPLTERIEYPVDMGRQDIYFGRALWPEELRALGYKERKQAVIDGINRLGPAAAEELPLPGDVAFAERVARHLAEHDVSAEHAGVFEVLRDANAPCDETRELLEGSASTPWLEVFRRWCLGR